MEKVKIELAICRSFEGKWSGKQQKCLSMNGVDVMLFLSSRDTFVFHVSFDLQLQQQFFHKRAESFDFCKNTVASTPKSQLIDPLRAKTAMATGIKSNCNVLQSPGMSPVLRKNVVMASQFRSKFNFLLLILPGKLISNFFLPYSAESKAALPHPNQPVVFKRRPRTF